MPSVWRYLVYHWDDWWCVDWYSCWWEQPPVSCPPSCPWRRGCPPSPFPRWLGLAWKNIFRQIWTKLFGQVGASIHVATSQIRHVLGIRKIAWLGPGRIIMTYIGHGKVFNCISRESYSRITNVGTSVCLRSNYQKSDNSYFLDLKDHLISDLPDKVVLYLSLKSMIVHDSPW